MQGVHIQHQIISKNVFIYIFEPSKAGKIAKNVKVYFNDTELEVLQKKVKESGFESPYKFIKSLVLNEDENRASSDNALVNTARQIELLVGPLLTLAEQDQLDLEDVRTVLDNLKETHPEVRKKL